MALQPTLRPLIIAGSTHAPHTLDVFLDYVCPFSAKMAAVIESDLKKMVGHGGKFDGKVKVIFRNQVQPWHASSTFVHEAGLAVARASPDVFWAFSLELFKQQMDFFDGPTSTMTPLEIRAKLAHIVDKVQGNTKKFNGLLTLKGPGNAGVEVTNDLKYTIKFSRQNGIHVSPTVLWDGVVANEISSSWTAMEWDKFLAEKILV